MIKVYDLIIIGYKVISFWSYQIGVHIKVIILIYLKVEVNDHAPENGVDGIAGCGEEGKERINEKTTHFVTE